MPSDLSHIHHYVPEWYQKRFFEAGRSHLYRLDLSPERIKDPNGRTHTATVCIPRPPSRCFCTKDLYMLRFGQVETDKIERSFFGSVDLRGEKAVDVFARLDRFTPEISKANRPLLHYMGAQRFRTPRGLDWLERHSRGNRQSVLFLMMRMFEAHSTMWAEGVWEIVRADDTSTKFIVTDSPVTFYNCALPPACNPYPRSEEWDKLGTRTIFPLSLNRCLLITHVQYVRAPRTKPLKVRTNARSFQLAVQHFQDIQIGRQLSNDEVERINLILKKAATKFIAAGRKEWLYPELAQPKIGWATVDHDWFLMPNPWRVSFTREIRWGGGKGGSWSLDAYGRQPFDQDYDDQRQHDRDWISTQHTKWEWAKKRGLASRSRTMDHHDSVHDKMIDDYLASLSKPGRRTKLASASQAG